MKKLLKLIGKYKIFLVFSVIFAAISVVLQLYVPVLFGDAIDEVVFDLMVPVVVAQIIDVGVAKNDRGYIVEMFFVLLLMAAVGLFYYSPLSLI